MVRITVIQPSGESLEVDAEVGESVMRAALNSGVEGIAAECGGVLSCATCHAFIDPEWVDKLDSPSEAEKIMIDCAIEVRANSRLTCQIPMTEELDGLVIELPSSQY